MRMMLCPPTWMRAAPKMRVPKTRVRKTGVCSAVQMSVLMWLVASVGALAVGEAGVGDGEADERWLGDADAVADWDVRAGCGCRRARRLRRALER